MAYRAYGPSWLNRFTATGCHSASAPPFNRTHRLQRLHFLDSHGGGPFEPGGIPSDLLGLPQGAQVTLGPSAGFFLSQLAPRSRTDAWHGGGVPRWRCCVLRCAVAFWCWASGYGWPWPRWTYCGSCQARCKGLATNRQLGLSRTAQQTETVQPGVHCSLRAKAKALWAGISRIVLTGLPRRPKNSTAQGTLPLFLMPG